MKLEKMSLLIRCFLIQSLVILSCCPCRGDRDRVNRGKNCRDAFSYSVLQEKQNNFGHKFATESDAKFILQIIIEDSRTKLVKSKCVGSLIHPNWIITSSDCAKEAREKMRNPSLFKVRVGIDFGGMQSDKSKNKETFDDTYNVSRILMVSADDSICNPILLYLENPIRNRQPVCLTPKSIQYHRSMGYKKNEFVQVPFSRTPSSLTRGVATGWSSMGDIVVEKVMRMTGVRVEYKHCLEESEVEGYILCVTYNPNVHYYLLPGSALLSFNETPGGHKEIFLEGIACGNTSISFVNQTFFYKQTFLRLESYLTAIQHLTGQQDIVFYSSSASPVGLSTFYLTCAIILTIVTCLVTSSHMKTKDTRYL